MNLEPCGAEYAAADRHLLKCKRAKDHQGAAEGRNHNGFSDTCPTCAKEGCDGHSCSKPKARMDKSAINF